jgi:hypothetical protein
LERVLVQERVRVQERVLVQVPEQEQVQVLERVLERERVQVQERVLERGLVQERVPEQVLEQELAQEQEQVPEPEPGSVSPEATTQLPWNCVTGHGRSTSRLTMLAFQRFPVETSSTRTSSWTAKTRSSSG